MREGEQSCVEGAAKGGGNKEGDGGVVGEGAGDAVTLLFAIRGQVWVADDVVGDAEVVIALGMAEEMEGRSH